VVSKSLFAVLFKDLIDALSETVYDQLIGIDELSLRHLSEPLPNGALARSHHSN
jgi:hypothetical protein